MNIPLDKIIVSDFTLSDALGFKELLMINSQGYITGLGNIINIVPSGTFDKKPTTSQGISVGYSYFCTDKKTSEGDTDGIMIYHKGNNIWVDALGRVIS